MPANPRAIRDSQVAMMGSSPYKTASSGKIAPGLLRATRKGTEMTEQNGAAVGADNDLIDLSTEIVSAYVSHNALSVTDLPKLIADVHSALKGLQTSRVPEPTEELKPAVPVRKSIAPDYII